ncbi:MAG: hypothetical protein KIT72_08005 [Polyangiaceae bacterium]|nr:hypothetical protein [Polyangiaceae bacterium]MCW5790349.1 hypothetical protein [Polyangiaceae bacterium]
MGPRGEVSRWALVLGAVSIAIACGDEAAPSGGAPQLSLGELTGPEVGYVGEPVCLQVEVSPARAEVSYVWGDGARGAEPCHAFERPGHFLVSVEARAGSQRRTASRALAIVPRPLALPPTNSATLTISGPSLFVVNADAGSVTELDVERLRVIRETPVCTNPRTLALGSQGNERWLAVACQGSDELVQLPLTSGGAPVRLSLPRGSAPYGVTADPRGGVFYVSLTFGGEVVSVPVGEARIQARLWVAPEPRGLAALPDGRVLVTHWRASQQGSRLTQIEVRSPGELTSWQELSLPPDLGLNSDTDNDGVLSFMNQVAPSPSGHQAWLPALKANNQTGLFRTGRDLSFDTTARAVLGVLELPSDVGAAPVERRGGRHAFDDLDYASAVVFSPNGALAYVAISGSERVMILDAFSLNLAGSLVEVGAAPDGLALSAAGDRLFVSASLSRSVRVYDVSDLKVGSPLLADVSVVQQEPLSPQVLLGKQLFHRAADPRMSKSSYLSCASCHQDGEGDNLTWDFSGRGEGLRGTIPLAGRGSLPLGALHWSGNFDEVQDFELDIRGPQQGAGFLAESHFAQAGPSLGPPKAGLSPELDALAAYVRSLARFGVSPHRPPEGAAIEAEWLATRRAGEALFFAAETGCSSCHAGSAFTDSELVDGVPRLHDVGTLGAGSGQRLGEPLTGLDTPTLRGLWKSAPYLHDGSAHTLRDVLVERNPDDRHGTTSHLSEAELHALTVYLLTLDDLEP